MGKQGDLIYGTATGVLCAGIKALWAVGLVLATRSAGSSSSSARMAVWGFLVVPAIAYFSFMASQGASALWTGAPGGRWFGRPEVRDLLRPLPPNEVTLARAAGRGALGGLIGLAGVSVLIAAWLVICIGMVFLGPGLPILILWLAVTLGVAAVSLLWGAVIGAAIFCRRRFGWPVGLAVSAVLIALCNAAIGLFV